MGERSRNVTVAAPPRSPRVGSRTIRPDHRCADNRNAQDHDDDDQSRKDRGMVIAGDIQKQATREEYRDQNKRRGKDLHGLVSRWINATACLCSRRRDIAAPIRTFAPPGGQPVSESLLRHRGWGGRPRLVCQVTAHAKTFRGIGVRRSNSVGDRSARFRHIRHAVLRADRRSGNSLRDRRSADGQGGCSRKSKEGVHFGLLRKGPSNWSHQSSKISVAEIDNSVGNAVSGIPSAGRVLDFTLAAFKKIDRLGVLVAEPIPKGCDRNSTREKPAPIRHQKTNMLSRIRINDRGPTRVTDDRYDKPLRFLSAVRKYPFDRQRAIEGERAAIGKLYFRHSDIRLRKTWGHESQIESERAVIAFTRAFCNLHKWWHPLALADALDVAGEA